MLPSRTTTPPARRQAVARINGLRETAPSLEVFRKEATGGSAKPLSLISLKQIQNGATAVSQALPMQLDGSREMVRGAHYSQRATHSTS